MRKIILLVTALSALFTSCNMLEDSWFDWSDDSYSAYISRSYDDAKHEDLVIRNKEAYINLTQGAGGTMDVSVHYDFEKRGESSSFDLDLRGLVYEKGEKKKICFDTSDGNGIIRLSDINQDLEYKDVSVKGWLSRAKSPSAELVISGSVKGREFTLRICGLSKEPVTSDQYGARVEYISYDKLHLINTTSKKVTVTIKGTLKRDRELSVSLNSGDSFEEMLRQDSYLNSNYLVISEDGGKEVIYNDWRYPQVSGSPVTRERDFFIRYDENYMRIAPIYYPVYTLVIRDELFAASDGD